MRRFPGNRAVEELGQWMLAAGVALASPLAGCSSDSSADNGFPFSDGAPNGDPDAQNTDANDPTDSDGGGEAEAAACEPPGPSACLVDGAVSPNLGLPYTDECPQDLPSKSDCRDDGPTYADVAPILAARCVGCHMRGGLAFDVPFDTYEGIRADRGGALAELNGCMMPPPCVCSPTNEERHKLLLWLVCDAPP